MNKKTRKVVLYGMLTAAALVLGYLESLIPAFFAVPGMKLGLSNLVVLVALYTLGTGSAVFINIVRIALSAVLFGNGMSFLYSIAGGALSLIVMIILKQALKCRPLTVSIAGGVFHNIGQIIVAVIMLDTTSIAWYLLILWFTGLASGAVIGILGGILVKRLGPAAVRWTA